LAKGSIQPLALFFYWQNFPKKQHQDSKFEILSDFGGGSQSPK
jgi:hypothetical protein